MMKKCILSLALVLALCIGLLPSAALAAEPEFVIKDVYELSGLFTDVLVEYNGPGGDVVIPSGVKYVGLGLGIESSGEGGFVFAGREDITSVTIPEGVLAIGGGAFDGCTGLTSVTLPSTLQDITNYAFRGCTGLTSITIPGSVNRITTQAFGGCTGLTSVTLSEGIKRIGGDAFRGCTGLTSIVLPSSATVEGLAFKDCTNLIDITIPETVTFTGNPFDGTAWREKQGDWLILNGTLIEYVGNETNVIIPDSVTSLGSYWFRGDWDEVKSISIPNSVTAIGTNSFNGGFTGPWGYIHTIDIPSSVKSIGTGAFAYSNLYSLIIPDSVTSIGVGAFSRCQYLSSITIPGSVTSIGERAFADTPNVTIHGSAGSYAENYAKENNIPFVADLAPISTVGGFSDVQVGEFYADAVLWAVENSITTGTTAVTFSPNLVCTKAEILTFLWRSQGCPEPTIDAPFSGMSPSDFYYKAALWACETGIVFSGDFGRECTRSFAVMYLWRLAGCPSAAPSAFTDVPADAEYAQAVAWAVSKGITTGTSETTFSPDATCTRGQIVTFLYRAFA